MSILRVGFGPEMAYALASGQKTQFRVLAEPKHKGNYSSSLDVNEAYFKKCPYSIGDVLWVAESWALPPDYSAKKHGNLEKMPDISPLVYGADYRMWDPWPRTNWRTWKTMPRWASRTTLEVTGVRLEKLNDITDVDAYHEGMSIAYIASRPVHVSQKVLDLIGIYRYRYLSFWDTTISKFNGKVRVVAAENPVVWAVKFKAVNTGKE